MSHSIRPTPALFAALFAVLALGAALSAPFAQGAAVPLAPGVTDELSQPKGPLPDRYIVVLKNSVERPGRVAERHAENRGAQINHVYRSALKGYAATISKSELAAVKADPNVAYVERDGRGGIAAQSVPTGIDRVFATANEALAINEEDDLRVDANIAIIDTGVAEHPDLDLVSHVNCHGQPCAEGGTDGNGHGTHVAGTAAAIDNDFGVVGVAPGARVFGVQVLDSGGFGELSEFIAGIDWVTSTRTDEDPDNDIDVANSSLRYWCCESSQAFEEAVEASMDAGVVHVAAAGNDEEPVRYVPGNHPDVITVSALEDYDGEPNEGADPLAWFSNYGPLVDVVAPGVEIFSTVPGGYEYESGTSMASPHVAGAAAILAAEGRTESAEDVEASRDTIVEAGNFDWTDTSPDEVQEPLLDVGDEEVFALAPVAPKATTLAATAVVSTMATLNATVNPKRLETTYQFEYGKTTAYGSKVPAEPKSIGNGTKSVAVDEPIEGLEPSTTYHFRVVATNKVGTTEGEDFEFTTLSPKAPAAETMVPTDVSDTTATLRATVNPQGSQTTYQLEYGLTQSYGSTIPLSPKAIGAGTENVVVSEEISVEPVTLYHYRVVATNEFGTSYGNNRSFYTPGTLDTAWTYEGEPLEGVQEVALSGSMTRSSSFNLHLTCDFTANLEISEGGQGEVTDLEFYPECVGEGAWAGCRLIDPQVGPGPMPVRARVEYIAWQASVEPTYRIDLDEVVFKWGPPFEEESCASWNAPGVSYSGGFEMFPDNPEEITDLEMIGEPTGLDYAETDGVAELTPGGKVGMVDPLE